MSRPTHTKSNPIVLIYYPFMISLDKCSKSCNVLSPKMCSKRKKGINVKAFSMI